VNLPAALATLRTSKRQGLTEDGIKTALIDLDHLIGHGMTCWYLGFSGWHGAEALSALTNAGLAPP